MRPGPATQAALLSRTFRNPSFACAKDRRTMAHALVKVHSDRRSPEACASGLGFGASILLGRRTSEEAAKPGHRHTGQGPNSPGDSLSRKSPATPNPNGNGSRTSHAFDCKHFAAAEELTQRQSGVRLCKNCGAVKLPVEGKGKVCFYWRDGGLPYNTFDDCASSRNVAGETSEPGDSGDAWGRL
jgi:hypothetical protein